MGNKQKYQDIFIKSLAINSNKFNENIKYNEITEWDSIGHMTLMSDLEEGFGITMETDDIVDFSSYKNKGVAIHCSSDCVIPMWAYMLVTSHLNNVASEIHSENKEIVFQKLFLQNIESIRSAEFKNKKVIVKGCGHIPLTEALYIAITKKLQNTVSSLMFGEACSAVPVFKKK